MRLDRNSALEIAQLKKHIQEKNLEKEPGLEDVKVEIIPDELGLKIKELVVEQTQLQNLAGIREYIDKQKSLLETQEKISELKAILDNAVEKDTDTRDGLNTTIAKLRLLEEASAKTSHELDAMDQNMTQEVIDGLNRMKEIEEEIVTLETNERTTELDQVPGGIDEVDSFSLN
ncbi:MAG: hypothetical protein QG654_567 [Patescibacteria group bacterium]|nr:hypothetical protein [Patescibacteria group bacterium]